MKKLSVFFAIALLLLSFSSCDNGSSDLMGEADIGRMISALRAHELIQNAIKEESDETIAVRFSVPGTKASGSEVLDAEVTFSGYIHGSVKIETGTLFYRFYSYSSGSAYIYPQSYSVETTDALIVQSEAVEGKAEVLLSVPEELNAAVDGYVSTADGTYELSSDFTLYIPSGCTGFMNVSQFPIDEIKKPAPVVEDKKEVVSVEAYVDVRKGSADIPEQASVRIAYDDNTTEDKTLLINEDIDVSKSGVYKTNTVTVDGKSYPVEVFVYDYTIAEVYAFLNNQISDQSSLMSMLAWISNPESIKYVFIQDGCEMESIGIPSTVSLGTSSITLRNIYFRGELKDAAVKVVSKNNPSFLEVSASDVTFEGLSLDFTDAQLINGTKYNAIIIGESRGQQVITANLAVKDCSIIGAGKVAFGISIPEYSSGAEISNTELTGCDTSLIIRNDTSLDDVSADSDLSIIVSSAERLDSIEVSNLSALKAGINVNITAPEDIEDSIDAWITRIKGVADGFGFTKELQKALDVTGADITPWGDGGSYEGSAELG